MGDISGRPKTPSQQVVYVPQYVYPETSAGIGTSNNNADNGAGETPAMPTPAQQREQNLLGRQRSRLGTILTGFRGILSPNEAGGQRKTLLGE